MNPNDNLPPCATWKLWTGKEIEGSSDLGAVTLFVREASPEQIFDAFAAHHWREPVKRVWFCKEFIYESSPAHMKILCARLLELRIGLKIVFELDALGDHVNTYMQELRSFGQFYIKLPLNLNEGDHVCVGPAFNDEAFRIGDGKKVESSEYLNDQPILE